MAVFKCKMCGGNIEFNPGDSIGVCDSCGTKQTLPKASDDAISSLYNRANTLRIKSEFDRAEEMYNKIITADETQAEAYWGIILCKYGIEYVEDPKTFKRVPTCHRASFDSLRADSDFKLALKYGDAEQKKIYRAEAKAIDSIQKDILKIANNEKPFDVFLCYKETDDSGKRTQDSVIANDIYQQLSQEGFKVFYAAITLEDKLGQEYEPYIFAALNSAKVMLVIGSKPEYFTAVWVKNEWSRFLKLMKNDRSKLLIPCYKDMDAYELPDEFAHLQAQDMSKIGFINDVVRGIKKVVTKDSEPAAVSVPVAAESDNSITPLLKRAFMFLEDGSFDEADEYCERVLDKDPENAEAYLGKLMAELKVRKQEELKNCGKPFDTSTNYQKAVRFGDDSFAEQMKADNEENQKYIIYQDALKTMKTASDESGFKSAASMFDPVVGYKDADSLKEQCLEKAEAYRKDGIYQAARKLMTGFKTEPYEAAISKLETIPGWKDADEQIEICRNKIEEIKEQEDFDRLEAERKAEQFNIKKESFKQKLKIGLKFGIPIIAAIVIIIIVLSAWIIPNVKYNKATKLMEEKDYQSAITYFEKLNGFKDSAEQIENCNSLIVEEKYMDASALFEKKEI